MAVRRGCKGGVDTGVVSPAQKPLFAMHKRGFFMKLRILNKTNQ